MIELPFDCINVHTLSCHRHPRGSEDSEQDNFPFKSMPVLPPGLLGPRGHLLGEMGPASPAQTFIFPKHEASAREVQRAHYPGRQPGRAGTWGGLGAGGGDPAWPAFGTRRQDAVSNSPHGSEGCCYFSVLAGMGGELRKVKWAGQDHTVSVCQKWGSRSGVFNRLFCGYLRGPWPPVFL